jgi:TetR/AcrR family acrAB operon transcriptional repressor
MARKTKEDAEATREGILDAAEQCFLHTGVSRATLEQIAARAGYTRGAVYWHFKNKMEVLHALIDRIQLPIFSGLDALGAPDDPQPLESLRAFHRHVIGELQNNPHARVATEITLLRCEYVEDTAALLERYKENSARAQELVTRTLQRARELGQLRRELDPAACALTLHFIVMGGLRHWAVEPGRVDLSRDVLGALDATLQSYTTATAVPASERKAKAAPRRAMS